MSKSIGYLCRLANHSIVPLPKSKGKSVPKGAVTSFCIKCGTTVRSKEDIQSHEKLDKDCDSNWINTSITVPCLSCYAPVRYSNTDQIIKNTSEGKFLDTNVFLCDYHSYYDMLKGGKTECPEFGVIRRMINRMIE